MGIDTSLLLALNRGLESPALDAAMISVSDPLLWLPALVLLSAYLLLEGGPLGRAAVVSMLLAAALTDPLCGLVLKPLFARPRPCHELGDAVRTIAGCGGAFGMPSNHAANAAALATALGMVRPRWLWAAVPAALAVGLSRIYLGKHYPSDVLAGWAVGAAAGALAASVAARLLRRWLRPRRREQPE